jgi:hypothetical protein
MVWEYERNLNPNAALAVLLSYGRQYGHTNTNITLEIPSIAWPEKTRYDGHAKLRETYLVAFRYGYYAALAAESHYISLFGSNTEEDKARVLGFAEGQKAGYQTRQAWLKRFGA